MSSNIVTRLFFMHVISPLHVGVGEGVGHINLPTAREVTTRYPYVPGSSIKGVLRDAAEQKHVAGKDNPDRYGRDPVVMAFGPPTSRAGDARGGLVLTDASLLLLPMRSLVGGYALVTCPLCLRRLARAMAVAGETDTGTEALLALPIQNDQCLVGTSNVLEHVGQVLLEDVPLAPVRSTEVDDFGKWLAGKAWSLQEKDVQVPRITVVSDTLFGFFVRLYLEVRHRVQINDETGTAATSGPWLEEYVPAEAVMFGLAQGRKTAVIMEKPGTGADELDKEPETVEAEDSLDVLKEIVGDAPVLRFGGKSTGGAGRAFFRLLSREDQKKEDR